MNEIKDGVTQIIGKRWIPINEGEWSELSVGIGQNARLGEGYFDEFRERIKAIGGSDVDLEVENDIGHQVGGQAATSFKIRTAVLNALRGNFENI
ncbi:hypothetical protein HY213_03675 [Candidatus Peregrinibacteria bacterium]|nr:hypothetical protein [Candidatus Peregrinibacteria bacterium]